MLIIAIGRGILIIGAGQMGQLILRKILDKDSDNDYLPVAILDDKISLKGRSLLDVPIIGSINSYSTVIMDKGITLVLSTIDGAFNKNLEEYCVLNNVNFQKISINI